MTLDDFLREHRRKQDDFAREIGVSQAAVSRFVKGHRIPRPAIMKKIAKATGGRVSASDFYPSAAADCHENSAPSVSHHDAELPACPTKSLCDATRSLTGAPRELARATR